MGISCMVYSVSPQSARQVIDEPAGLHGLLESLAKGGACISLEKSWHGLHYILSGNAWDEGDPPLNFLGSGNKLPNDKYLSVDESTRVIFPEQVLALNSALATITSEEFTRRFNPEKLSKEGVYPSIWNEPLEDLLNEYKGYFQDLKAFVAKASEDMNALLIDIC